MPAYGTFSGGVETSQDGGGKRARPRPMESMEGEDELEGMEHTSDDPPGRALKRPRLVWTPQLHKRFCDAVNHLGVENAGELCGKGDCLSRWGFWLQKVGFTADAAMHRG